MARKKIYWDTSCFISFLSNTHPDEAERGNICEDILTSARNDEIEVWTSVWTIVETIRPKARYQPVPMPVWAELLHSKDDKGDVRHPQAHPEFDRIWHFYKRNTLPSRLLSEEQATKIRLMFDWPWIKKIQVIPAIAHRAAEIARTHNMKPGDAIHVASALHRNCDVLQRWDRDYAKTNDLIRSEDPAPLSGQDRLNFTP